MRFILLVLPLLISCISIPRVPPDIRLAPEQIATAVLVATDCVAEDGFSGALSFDNSGKGSGVIISERHVLTAAHAADCKGTVLPMSRVRLPDGRQFRMVIDKIDHDLDLARLELASADTFKMKIPPPKVGRIPVKDDPVCMATGMPKRGWNCGPMIETRGINRVILHAASTTMGNSGSGLYDGDGNLVGIVTGVVKADPTIGLAASLEQREDWVYGLNYED